MSPLAAGLAGAVLGLAIAAGFGRRRHRRLAAALGAERDHYRGVLEALDDAVIAADDRGRVTVVNPAARRLLGPEAPRPGQAVAEGVSTPELRALLSARPAVPRSAEFQLGPEPRRTVQARLAPAAAWDGAVLALRDITELRRLESLRRDFVANVSHELRTPVSVIQANAETLLDGALEDPEAALRFTRAVLRNADRLARLVADLLELSAIEVGHYKLEPRPIPVAACARRVREELGPRAGDQLALEVDEDLEVLADPRALEQILVNLVDNALKYGPEGSRVLLRASAQGDRVCIEVEDEGPGVPPESRPRLFERFYRVDPGRSRRVGGTGLGLAIVKHLAAAMRGRVGMRPAEPRGSVFWVELPVSEGR